MIVRGRNNCNQNTNDIFFMIIKYLINRKSIYSKITMNNLYPFHSDIFIHILYKDNILIFPILFYIKSK